MASVSGGASGRGCVLTAPASFNAGSSSRARSSRKSAALGGTRGDFEHPEAARLFGAGYFVAKPRLADARLAVERHRPALAGGRLEQQLQLFGSSVETRQAARDARTEARAAGLHALQLVDLDRRRDAFHRDAPERLRIDQAFGEA